MTEWKKLRKEFREKYYHADHEALMILLEVGDRMQSQNQAALKRIEEWCSDCLKPKFSCPSCVYQLTKEELGYRPRLSEGEPKKSDSKRICKTCNGTRYVENAGNHLALFQPCPDCSVDKHSKRTST